MNLKLDIKGSVHKKQREEERGIGFTINPPRVKGRKGVGLGKICPKKGKEEKRRASQKRSRESRPLSSRENYDRVGFADRLENNRCCHVMQPTANRFIPGMLAAGVNRKTALVRICCKNELCNPNCSFFHQLFCSFYSSASI